MKISTITDLVAKYGEVRVIKVSKEQMPMKVTLLKDKLDYDVRLNASGFMFEAKQNMYFGKCY